MKMKMKMPSAIAALVLGGMMAAPAFAQSPGAAANSQQTKMKTCNQQAAGKTGDDRKAFMKQCLTSKGVPQTRQQVMKTCNQQATGKTGDARKAFMKQCLSTKGN